jgi:hypothetical protein
MEQFEQICAQDRPIILAVLHYGPLIVLRYWLRACGLPVAGLTARSWRDRPPHRRYLDRISDAAGGLDGVPHNFDLSQLREVKKFLDCHNEDGRSAQMETVPGLAFPRLLIITAEGYDSQHALVRSDDFSFRMATGALRLAARANAYVIPCLIRADRPFGFTVHFGRPVPDEWLRDKSRHQAACEHLLHEFLPQLRAQPEQAGYQLLWCFKKLAPQPEKTGAARSGVVA